MNVIYTLQDTALKMGSSTAVAEIKGIYYDSQIGGIVVSCADGSALLKKCTVEYYAQQLKEFIQHAADDHIMFVAIMSMGAFLRAPAGQDLYLYVHGKKKEYEATIPAWDMPQTPPTLTPPKDPVSRMKLHGM